MLSLGLSYVLAQPGNNVPGPLNVGSSAQSKIGGLAVGTSTAPTAGFKLDVAGFLQSTGLNVNGTALISGKVGIGTAAPTSKLSVNGDANIVSNVTISSLGLHGVKQICVDDTGTLVYCP